MVIGKIISVVEKISENAPSLARRTKEDFLLLIKVRLRFSIMHQEEKMRKNLQHLRNLFQTDYPDLVVHKKFLNERIARVHRDESLPLPTDINTFKTVLLDDISLLIQNLQAGEDVYKDLCQLLLTRIITFNRRRSGEVAKLLIDDLAVAKNETLDDENYKELIEASEIEDFKNITVVRSLGKRLS